MKYTGQIIRTEWLLLLRDHTFWGLVILLFFLMSFAAWNTHQSLLDKEQQLDVQLELVRQNDLALIAQIDSLRRGLADYKQQYTLPTSGVRLTYNNHRLAWMPSKEYALIAIGQGDLHNHYKKIILYFNDSYERSSGELVSPIEQLFGQLDLTFVWTYLLPLIILLVSFNLLSGERETGRLRLIATQPIDVSKWLLLKIGLRFLILFALLILYTLLLFSFFGVSVIQDLLGFGQLVIVLGLYTAFWFFLSFLVNRLGHSSARSLILLTNLWILFVFLIPSLLNQLGKELHPLPARLEVLNHHQSVYNEVEHDLEMEMQALFDLHPDWQSDDPVTKDMSNSTGWNINFLAKEYLAQLKHQPEAQRYEDKIDERNQWFSRFRVLSPAMIFQSALTHLAGTSTRYYRSFLEQAQEYAQSYRQYVFKGLFTNHAFTAEEVKELPLFTFQDEQFPNVVWVDVLALLIYQLLIVLVVPAFIKTKRLIV